MEFGIKRSECYEMLAKWILGYIIEMKLKLIEILQLYKFNYLN